MYLCDLQKYNGCKIKHTNIKDQKNYGVEDACYSATGLDRSAGDFLRSVWLSRCLSRDIWRKYCLARPGASRQFASTAGCILCSCWYAQPRMGHFLCLAGYRSGLSRGLSHWSLCARSSNGMLGQNYIGATLTTCWPDSSGASDARQTWRKSHFALSYHWTYALFRSSQCWYYPYEVFSVPAL